jgi:uncharacterized protein (DUF1499 family)
MKKWLIGSLLFIMIAFILLVIYLNNKVPELGVNSGQLKALPSSPNAVSSQSKDSKSYVDPLALKSNSYKLIQEILQELDKTKIIKESPHYIHVVFSTRVGFKDDVEFYFDEKNNVIHYRSASRLGHSDMGKNRERYEKIKTMYLNRISD